MVDDHKSQLIAVHLAQALASMREHGYTRLDMPWEQDAFGGGKVVDSGMIYLRRNKDGSITARITDRYTENK